MGVGAVKCIIKGVEPPTLKSYRQAKPNAEWEEMKNDPLFNGQGAYQDCRSRSIDDQKGLCAFCEIDIRDNSPLKCRVEHFHPKSDHTIANNWALDWQNMLAVCSGGTRSEIIDPTFHLQPTKENLSCDAHKDMMIQLGKLQENCEGWVINPLQLSSSPSLFRVHKGSGKLEPDLVSCAAVEQWPHNNKHDDFVTLVQHTIDMFNLNCDRLMQARLRIIRHIEHNKKDQRAKGIDAQQGMKNLAQYYFRISWPGFFTTIRFCLGQAAEDYLNHVAFQG